MTTAIAKTNKRRAVRWPSADEFAAAVAEAFTPEPEPVPDPNKSLYTPGLRMGTDRKLEDMADELLKRAAILEKHSMRDYGIVDERRQRTINEREKPFADYFAPKRHEGD